MPRSKGRGRPPQRKAAPTVVPTPAPATPRSPASRTAETMRLTQQATGYGLNGGQRHLGRKANLAGYAKGVLDAQKPKVPASPKRLPKTKKV